MPPCGVSIVRLSGNDSLNILKKFTNLNKIKPQFAYYTSIKSPKSGKLIDRGLCLYFKEPHSYTGEDIVEFQIHGSPSIIQNLFRHLSEIPNCRPANKGEFTKRAYLNNKLDLSQVEGLYNLINSYSELQGENSQNEYEGHLSKIYNKWRNELKEMLVISESCIDFVEDEDIENMKSYKDELIPKINKLKREIIEYLSRSKVSEIIKNGLNIVLIGSPNVGKSSFYNLFTEHNYSIVSPIKGTTRDLIRNSINFEGIMVNIVDTAGIYMDDSNQSHKMNIIEKEGINRSLNEIKNKSIDIPLLICDSTNLNLKEYSKFKNLQGKKWWIVYNKIDLLKEIVNKNKLSEMFDEWNVYDIFPLSCKSGKGLNEFKNSLKDYIKKNLYFNVNNNNKRFDNNDVSYEDVNRYDNNMFISEERHKHHLKECVNNLDDCLLNINNIELCSYGLRECMNNIGRIIGIIDNEEILDDIFNKFCIGK